MARSKKKKKNNKKLIIYAVCIFLLTAIATFFVTYSMYRSSVTITGSINTAAWQVKVKKASEQGTGVDMDSASLTFGASDITWTGTHHGKNNTIAPGDTGIIQFVVDATGSEVDVVLTAEIDTSNPNYSVPAGITVAVTSGTNGTISIPYSSSSMATTVTIQVAWAGALSDNSTKDASDIASEGVTLTIPVKLVARQDL